MSKIPTPRSVFYNVGHLNTYNAAYSFQEFPRLTDEMWEITQACVFAQRKGYHYLLMNTRVKTFRRLMREAGWEPIEYWKNPSYQRVVYLEEKKREKIEKYVDNWPDVVVY